MRQGKGRRPFLRRARRRGGRARSRARKRSLATSGAHILKVGKGFKRERALLRCLLKEVLTQAASGYLSSKSRLCGRPVFCVDLPKRSPHPGMPRCAAGPHPPSPRAALGPGPQPSWQPGIVLLVQRPSLPLLSQTKGPFESDIFFFLFN